MGPIHAGEGHVMVGRTNKSHAHTPRGAGRYFIHDHMQATSSGYAYEIGECPPCAHTVRKNNTLTHTRPPRLNKWFHIYAYENGECPACAHTVRKNNTLTHTRPPRLNKWFHILPSFVFLLATAPCLSAHFIHSFF